MSGRERVIRVVIVDDQELVRAGFRALLDAEDDVEVVGEAGAGDAAVVTVAATGPDAVLMDIRMPGANGIEATRRIRRLDDPPEVLILTTFDTDENVFDALEAGAAGFLVKDTPPTQLIEALRAAVAGGAVISPATTRRLVDHLVATRLTRDRSAPQGLELLTDREREVLELVALGCSNREIAAADHLGADREDPRVPPAHQARGLEPGAGRGAGLPHGARARGRGFQPQTTSVKRCAERRPRRQACTPFGGRGKASVPPTT